MSLLQQIPFLWQKELWDKLTSEFRAGKLAHAYLISGAQGIGKELFTYGLAKFIMCSAPGKLSACGSCTNCKYNGEGGHPDTIALTIEEGSRDIKIEQVRSMSGFLEKTSHTGRAKVAIIANAHRMNTGAANALLKTLEEPTENTYLLLSTHLPGSLPATIRSRCHKVSMQTPDQKTAIDWLSLHIPDQEDPLALARSAQNRPLYGLELSHTDGLENQQQFLNKLVQLSAGKTSIQATVALSKKIGEQVVVRYLIQISIILVKYLLTSQQSSELEPGQQELLSMFQPGKAVSISLLLSLMGYYDQAQESHRQLLSNTNPNPQLIMESLLWRWSQLSRSIPTR